MLHHEDNQITFLARTNFRNERRPFGIRQADRLAHMYIIGKTGTGKSTLLETMIRQDVVAGRGLALLDPHGDLVERLFEWIPEDRREDLIYFNVPETTRPLGFNPLEKVPPEKISLAASGVLEVFKKIWADAWGPRLEHILRNALLALFEQRSATLGDILRLLDDKDYRKLLAFGVSNEQVRRFWLKEYESYPSRFRAEAIAPVQNKVGAFLADPILNGILNQRKSDLQVREIMDSGKTLLVNLAKGKIGEDSTTLLGALIVSSISLAALSRADTPEGKRRRFFLYLDEFQAFTNLGLANMLAELRKYRTGLILAHQHLSQVDSQIREAILGNAGTIISFRVGVEDAEIFEKEFSPEFTLQDLIRLPNYSIYVKIMVNGVISNPFSGETLGVYPE